jgi:hypothetical protein
MQEMHKRKLYICYKGAPHTKLTNNRLEGRQKGLDTTGKRVKKHKPTRSP